jgi:hypothetical protein
MTNQGLDSKNALVQAASLMSLKSKLQVEWTEWVRVGAVVAALRQAVQTLELVYDPQALASQWRVVIKGCRALETLLQTRKRPKQTDSGLEVEAEAEANAARVLGVGGVRVLARAVSAGCKNCAAGRVGRDGLNAVTAVARLLRQIITSLKPPSLPTAPSPTPRPCGGRGFLLSNHHRFCDAGRNSNSNRDRDSSNSAGSGGTHYNYYCTSGADTGAVYLMAPLTDLLRAGPVNDKAKVCVPVFAHLPCPFPCNMIQPE